MGLLMKRAVPSDWCGFRGQSADSQNVYGLSITQAAAVRAPWSNLDDQTVIFQQAGTLVERVWALGEAGWIWCLVETTATSVYTLYLSKDYGATWELAYQFDTADKYLLVDGLTIGYPNGVRTFALAEYYTGASAPLFVATSTNGTTWTTAATITGGTSSNIRHFHCVTWNQYNNQWILGAGDTDAQSMILSTADLSLITNSTPATLATIPGLKVATGQQRFRPISVLITPTHLFTCADVITGDEKGIWRMPHDLSWSERVDYADGRYETGSSRSDGWSGLIHDGQIFFTNFLQNAQSGRQHLEIYSASVGDDGPGAWREIARYYCRAGTSAANTGFFAHGGRFGLSSNGGCGKMQGDTAFFTLGTEFCDDQTGVLAPGTNTVQYIPDTIHPVFWVGGGSNSNTGFSPRAAYGTLQYALTGSAGSGNRTISSITEAAGIATVTTATAHGYAVADRVTLAGNTPAAYNNTYHVASTPSGTQFTIRVPSGTGNGTVLGTVNSSFSAVPFGACVWLNPGAHVISDSIVARLNQYATTPSGALSQFGFEGESVHFVQIRAAEKSQVQISNTSASQNYLIQLNTTTDWLVMDSVSISYDRNVTSARVLEPAAVAARVWSRDCVLGDAALSSGFFRNGASNNATHRSWRCLYRGDGTALTTGAVDVSGNSTYIAESCYFANTHTPVFLRTVGAGIIAMGCTFYGWLNRAVQASAVNGSSFKLIGNVFANISGTNAAVDSSSGTFSTQFSVEYNLMQRTGLQTRDRSSTNIDMQVLGTALSDYFEGDSPANPPKAGSALVDAAGAFIGSIDFNSTPRNNPSSIGCIERPAIDRRSGANRRLG